ncbi:transcriptional regulator, partial [Streptomyces sp. SID4917]|nr:transcriptional regulator [Streptomyces sp. SID4917]
LPDRRYGQPLRALEVHAADGRRLDADDTIVNKVL